MARPKIHRSLKAALAEPHLVTQLDLSISNRRAPVAELASLPNLEHLSLRTPHPGFDLHGTLDAAARCPRLRELGLFDGTVPALPANLAQLRALQRIDVWNSGLQAWPEALAQLPALRAFMVLRHGLGATPEGLGDCAALEHLVLQQGSLVEVPSLPPRLVTLHLSGNQLREVPAALSSLRCLSFVQLQANPELRALPPWFIDLPSLTWVEAPDTAGRAAVAAWKAAGRNVGCRLYADEAPYEAVADPLD